MGSSSLTTGSPLSPAVDLIFSRWSPHILWALGADGPLRYGDLRSRLYPVGTATLAQRLRELESAGLLQRTLYMRHPPRVEYSLTELGRTVIPVLGAVADWSRAHLMAYEIGDASIPGGPL
ncbi:winged helix-turn-helix transcriptional regulator [Actinoplanes sp. HUAS TT8]|uniref:winged helix-turn-helix transcriptional regulator n=1 Tax=Actinoplanes sp. HUAS TT8 TaxID=3447453 RepID=UPI003F528B64